MDEIWKILKPGGYFFATLKALEKISHRQASILMIRRCIWQDPPEKDIPHFYSQYEDIREFFSAFQLKSLKLTKLFYGPEFIEADANWHFEVLAQKPFSLIF